MGTRYRGSRRRIAIPFAAIAVIAGGLGIGGAEVAQAAPTAVPRAATVLPMDRHFKPTGYFRVDRRDGRWWFVTPDGRPFYSSGVDHVSTSPDTDRTTGLCPYCMTIGKEYPSTTAWATATVDRLRSWGFNTIGSFSDYSNFAAQMPYTELLSMASGNDWFAPSFVTNAYSVAASQIAPLADDTNLIGWYTDSELQWGPDWRSTQTVLARYLALPTGSPGLKVAERYVGRPDTFVRVLATRYFRVTSAAIRKYDRHHLILGVKAPAQLIQPALLEGARPFVDVFSIDDYALIPGLEDAIQRLAPQYLNPTPNLSNIEAIVNRPLIIGEYGFRAADSGLPNTYPPIFPVYSTQADRASVYESFIKTMYSAPWVIGDSWFEYVDEPAGGRFDGENSNWGLVNVGDVPYGTMVGAAMAMHSVAPTSQSGSTRQG